MKDGKKIEIGGRKRKMGLEEKKATGEEKRVAGGRTPLEMEVGKTYLVALRGGGVYGDTDAKDFRTDKVMEGVKLRNALIVVCNPEDSEEIYTISSVIEPKATTLGTDVLSFLHKVKGEYWLKDELLNAIGDIGMVEQSKEGREKPMQFLTWDPKMKKGKQVYLEGDLPAETVGSAQRGDVEVATGSDMEF